MPSLLATARRVPRTLCVFELVGRIRGRSPDLLSLCISRTHMSSLPPIVCLGLLWCLYCVVVVDPNINVRCPGCDEDNPCVMGSYCSATSMCYPSGIAKSKCSHVVTWNTVLGIVIPPSHGGRRVPALLGAFVPAAFDSACCARTCSTARPRPHRHRSYVGELSWC